MPKIPYRYIVGDCVRVTLPHGGVASARTQTTVRIRENKAAVTVINKGLLSPGESDRVVC